MPYIQLETNIKVEDSKALVLKLSKFSSQVLGKPESRILAKYTHNETLCMDGSFEPAFILTVGSIGTFLPEANPSFVAEYTKFLKENLGVDDKRGYISLNDPGYDTTGFSGTTLAKLLGK
ncbi:Tautomerase/MIF [Schizopora paradoxa]|uniref:L-dopachrome isomerase n=1 Tax=Schizopora paradoxa TaxID=27342 RepID=A0A0H2S4H8_9AGAM|nr:Tautomerase/MIF [Schizopora paradoxa]